MNCTNCQAGQLASSDRVNFICNNCRAHYRYNPATSTIDFVGIIAAQTPTVNAGPNNFSGNNSNNDSLRSRVAAMQSNNANQPLGHDPENWPNQNDLPSFVKPKNNLKKILFIIPAILILALGGLIFYNFNYLKKHNASAIAQNFSSDLEKINSKIDFKVTMSGDNVGTVKVFPATLNFNSLNDTSGNSSINTVLDMVDAKIDLSFLLRDNYAKVYGKINNLEVGSNLADQYPDISTQLDDLDKSWYLLSSSNSNSSSLIPELVTGCEEKGNIVKFISSLSKDDLGAIKYSVKSPKLFISDLKYEIKASGNLKQFLSVLKSINSKAPSECQIATEDLDRLESESAAILEKITADFSVVLTKTNFKFDLNLTGLENIYQQNTSSRATDNDSCDLLSESNTAADIIEDCSESSSSTDNLFEKYAKLKTINFSSEIVLDNNISVEAEPKDYQTLDELLNSFTQPKEEEENTPSTSLKNSINSGVDKGIKLFNSYYRI